MHRTSLKMKALLPIAFTIAFGCMGAQQTVPPYPAVFHSPADFKPPQVDWALATSTPYINATLPFFSSSTSRANGPDDGQQPAPQVDVQAPQPQTNADGTSQTWPSHGVTPNFRAANADTKLPPQTVRQKFNTATQDSIEYSSTVLPAVLASLYFGLNTVPQFGHGGTAFGRYLWHATVDQTVETYMVEFVAPVITHEDTRYYALGHGGFLKRTDYALSRAVITRSDSGKEVFNISEIAGAGAAAGLTNLYYPAPQRTVSNTAINWSLDVGLDAATFVLREFWPDIDQRLFHKSR